MQDARLRTEAGEETEGLLNTRSLDQCRDKGRPHVLPASVACPFALFPAASAKRRLGPRLSLHHDDTSNKNQDKSADPFIMNAKIF